ncbi:hypothetical protein [Polyangium jinanense]|uniref:Lipoprotein n=1 Tax=Polyangium jinanense TaxID=2829994 RepID=A0A9X3X238_9BACT|nr:hypothetical protein [Polyangium jinanense]MDC3954575.1 hypothetical protein [Polyangium jinanense]MDC3980878.1 hypothetical protein [Polyangium jinanense]
MNRKAFEKNPRLLLLALPLVLALLAGCKRGVECTTEITAGAGTFKGTAHGEGEKGPVMKAALRNACQKMCVDTKSPMLDACITRCTVDVGATKIGARSSCND